MKPDPGEPMEQPGSEPRSAQKQEASTHPLTMNSYDAWTLCDWSSEPTVKLGDLLSLPPWEVIRKHGPWSVALCRM